MHLDASQGTCLSIAVVLFLLCGCSPSPIEQSAVPAAAPAAAVDLHQTLIGKTESEVVELLGEPDEMEATEVMILEDATDEEMQRWYDEMNRTVTAMYSYQSRDLAVLFNGSNLVIATKPLDQAEPQTGSRID